MNGIVTQRPVFVVVGHPNKGKSSIVATLARDDSVEIGPLPGTTLRARRYPMRVDGETLYELVDTPGFQRARAVLAWLRAHETTAADRARVVAAFVREHQGSGRFDDECELLAPILDGGGILYVTDGSHPYGEEYDAEMEILRWTGQPAMGLINRIGPGDHVDEWRSALHQYFAIVREFDPMHADLARRLELLRAFGELRESWRSTLTRAADVLDKDNHRRCMQAAREIADMLAAVITLQLSVRVAADDDLDRRQRELQEAYRERLREHEQHCRDAVEFLYAHRRLQRREGSLGPLASDLFSAQAQQVFGLTRSQLAATAGAGGALAGGGIDAALGGASMLLGAALGGALGGASTWLGWQRIADVKVRGLELGGSELRVGPVRDPGFPFVVLGRALFHHALISRRSHAERATLDLDALRSTRPSELPGVERRRLASLFAELRRAGALGGTRTARRSLADSVAGLLKRADLPDPPPGTTSS